MILHILGGLGIRYALNLGDPDKDRGGFHHGWLVRYEGMQEIFHCFNMNHHGT